MMNNELIPTPMMSFGESVKTCFQKYVTFKGRIKSCTGQESRGYYTICKQRGRG